MKVGDSVYLPAHYRLKKTYGMHGRVFFVGNNHIIVLMKAKRKFVRVHRSDWPEVVKLVAGE